MHLKNVQLNHCYCYYRRRYSLLRHYYSFSHFKLNYHMNYNPTGYISLVQYSKNIFKLFSNDFILNSRVICRRFLLLLALRCIMLKNNHNYVCFYGEASLLCMLIFSTLQLFCLILLCYYHLLCELFLCHLSFALHFFEFYTKKKHH